MTKQIAMFKFFLAVLATVAIAACSSSSDSTGPGSGGGSSSGGGALVVPDLDFGALPPGQTYDSLVAISNSSGDYLTITKNGTSEEARDTNFRQPIVLTPHGYKLINVQFAASDTGARTAYDSIHYQGAGSVGVALLKMTANVSTSAPPRSSGGGGGGGNGGGGNGGGGGNPIFGPNANSTFTYHYTSDTNGVPLPAADSTYTVLSNSLTYQGKTNVIKVKHPDGGVDYTHIEDNGDISVFVNFSLLQAINISIPSQWFTIPLGSKKEIQTSVFDSTMSFGGAISAHVTVTTDAKDVGAKSVTVQSQPIACEQGTFTVTINAAEASFGVSLLNIQNSSDIWYGSSIKFIAERKDTQTQTVSPLLQVLLGQQLPGFASGTASDTYMLKSFVEK